MRNTGQKVQYDFGAGGRRWNSYILLFKAYFKKKNCKFLVRSYIIIRFVYQIQAFSYSQLVIGIPTQIQQCFFPVKMVQDSIDWEQLYRSSLVPYLLHDQVNSLQFTYINKTKPSTSVVKLYQGFQEGQRGFQRPQTSEQKSTDNNNGNKCVKFCACMSTCGYRIILNNPVIWS